MNILCFGDSNTFGYDPRDFFGGCYDNPWPQILAEQSGWNVQNHGENGREIPHCKVQFPQNVTFLIIMLGTNDLLQANSIKTITQRMETFLNKIALEKEKILLIAPPPMKLGAWVSTPNIVEASKKLAHVYHDLSLRLGVRFVNADKWDIPIAFDGVHFTEEGHRAFALALTQYLIKEITQC